MAVQAPALGRKQALHDHWSPGCTLAGAHSVTGLTPVHCRTVLETTRTLFVWLVDLVLFYTPLGMGKLGESWSIYSWIQAAG